MKWSSIETFFLDMDGTILDLAYDDYFWHYHIPALHAEKNKITFNDAKLEFEGRYKKRKNTIQWYSLDFWSNELGINLNDELIKTRGKIKVLPGIKEFLNQLKKREIKIILLTNCPRKMLHVKLTQTKLWGYFHKIISSEDFGYPKESDDFWTILKEKITYKENKTIFIDDNLNILKYAHKNGINKVIGVNYPDSKKTKQVINGFESLDNISLFKEKFID